MDQKDDRDSIIQVSEAVGGAHKYFDDGDIEMVTVDVVPDGEVPTEKIMKISPDGPSRIIVPFDGMNGRYVTVVMDAESPKPEEKKDFVWDHEAMKLFFSEFSSKISLFDNRKLKSMKLVYEEMSKVMQSKGLDVSPLQVENKYKSLIRAYRNHVANSKKSTRRWKRIPYEKQLIRMLTCRRNTIPKVVSGRHGLVTEDDVLMGTIATSRSDEPAVAAATITPSHPSDPHSTPKAATPTPKEATPIPKAATSKFTTPVSTHLKSILKVEPREGTNSAPSIPTRISIRASPPAPNTIRTPSPPPSPIVPDFNRGVRPRDGKTAMTLDRLRMELARQNAQLEKDHAERAAFHAQLLDTYKRWTTVQEEANKMRMMANIRRETRNNLLEGQVILLKEIAKKLGKN